MVSEGGGDDEKSEKGIGRGLFDVFGMGRNDGSWLIRW